MSWEGGEQRIEDLPDEELVRIALEDRGSTHSRDAASQLFGRYRKRVYTWCYRLVRHHDKAMDLAQDALLNGYRSLASYQHGCPFSSWLYAIARNRCFNELRRPALFAGEAIDLDGLAGPTDDPAEILMRKLDERRLLALIHEHLDEEEQSVLWLRCMERLPIDAITEVLGIEQASGARGLLQRARRKLRAALGVDVVGKEQES